MAQVALRALALALALCCGRVAGVHAVGDAAEGRQLLLTQVLFRHGDRSQVAEVPLYENTIEQDWPMGLGQLTSRGREMHFSLGRFFQHHYKDFTTHYHPSTVRVRSTDYERTLESAQALMSGWFCESKTASSPTCLCRTFPIHTVPSDEDSLLLGSRRDNCEHLQYLYHQLDPAFTAKAKEAVPDALCKNLNEMDQDDLLAPPPQRPPPDPSCNVTITGQCTYAHVLDRLSVLTGVAQELTPRSAWTISDTDLCRMHHNLSVGAHAFVSDGCDGILHDYLQRLEGWDMFVVFQGAERARLSGGTLLKEMRTQMEARVAGDSSYKVLLYSAHDTTVAAFLEALNASHPRSAPPYASSVRVELYKRGGGGSRYEVDVWYKTRPEDDKDTGLRLVVPDCPADATCDYETFVKGTQKRVPKNWHHECTLPSITKEVLSPAGLAIIVSLCVLVMLTIIWVYRRRIRRGTSIVYRRATSVPTSVLQGMNDGRMRLTNQFDDDGSSNNNNNNNGDGAEDDEEEDVYCRTSLANMQLKARKVTQA